MVGNGLAGWLRSYAPFARILNIVNTLFPASSLAEPVHGKLSNIITTILHYK